MFGDLWCKSTTKNKKTILADFDQRATQPVSKRIGQAKAIMRIEKFTDMVLASNKPAFKFSRKYPDQFKETFIGKRLKEVLPLVKQFDSYHTYTSSPAVFFRAFWLVNSIYGFRLAKPMHRNVQPDVHRAEVMNYLIDQIRFEASQLWFQRFAYDRKYETMEKTESLVEYTKAILRYHSKVLVVRVDFGYEGGEEAQVSIEDVLNDLHEMLYYRASDSLFKHLVGYGWAVEQGSKRKKGYHIHAVFFFDGSRVREDVSLGFLIGKRWVKHATRGKGNFRNCNYKKEENYERVGIGMIHRNNEQECANCIEFVQYLAKGGRFIDRDDQYVRIRPRDFNTRMFGTGQAPALAEARRGRPASDAPWLAPAV